MAMNSTRKLNQSSFGFDYPPESSPTTFNKGRTRALPNNEVKASSIQLPPQRTRCQAIKQRLIDFWEILVSIFCCRICSENRGNPENRDQSLFVAVPPMSTEPFHDEQSGGDSLEGSHQFSLPQSDDSADMLDDTHPKEVVTTIFTQQPFSSQADPSLSSPLTIDTSMTEEFMFDSNNSSHYKYHPALTLKYDPNSLSADHDDSTMHFPALTLMECSQHTTETMSPTGSLEDLENDAAIDEKNNGEDSEDNQSNSSITTVIEKSTLKKSPSQDSIADSQGLVEDEKDAELFDEALPECSVISLVQNEERPVAVTLDTVPDTIMSASSPIEPVNTEKDKHDEYSHSDEKTHPPVTFTQYDSKLGYLDSLVLIGEELIELLDKDKKYRLLTEKDRTILLSSIKILITKSAEHIKSKERFSFFRNCLTVHFEGNHDQYDSEVTTYTNALDKLIEVVVAVYPKVETDDNPISVQLRKLHQDVVELLPEDTGNYNHAESVDSAPASMQRQPMLSMDAPITMPSLNDKMKPNQDPKATEESPLLKQVLSATEDGSDGEDDVYEAQTFNAALSLPIDTQQLSMNPEETIPPVFMNGDKGYLSITPEEIEVPTDSMGQAMVEKLENQYFQEAKQAKAKERRQREKQKGSKIPISQHRPSTYIPKSRTHDLAITEWEKEMSLYGNFTSLTRTRSDGDISQSVLSEKSTSKAKSCAGYTPRTQDENGWTNPHKNRKKENNDFRKRKSTESLKMGFGSREPSRITRDPNTFGEIKTK
ncbi:hypothetical protein GCM10023116_28990 [Kistimonas scapharcae]|uniref:Uncharacterized protein n=1 Tax=Kistimonas scapharcae TaxID=1036133 RepID=A0ABP8V5Q4_9GAMM